MRVYQVARTFRAEKGADGWEPLGFLLSPSELVVVVHAVKHGLALDGRAELGAQQESPRQLAVQRV